MNIDQDFNGEDQDLLAELGALDPVPIETVARAKSGFAWLTLDAELAELTYDSTLDADPLVGVRGDGGPRALTFEAAGSCLEVEAHVEGDRRKVIGQVVPPAPGTVEVRHREGTLTVPVDDFGQFSAAGLAPGPVSLRWRPTAAEEAAVVTDWVVV